MITELPKDARQCSLPGVYITPDAKVFKAGKNGFREVTVKADKKGHGKFYNSAEKKYYSLTQAYAEAFVPNGEQKPLAFIKDASHGLDPEILCGLQMMNGVNTGKSMLRENVNAVES